ncbi:MAG: glycosyltransferase family 2 protein [Deltaproteobacteria bacterium]|nr:glycosyltransferase family 2 protein [Deltaproteobacteria bacterium]
MARTTVIVLNWNGKDLLEECLTSLRAQTDRDFDTMVVDNGSHDGSVEFVSTRFPEVRVLALPENYGFAKGNNLGMREVSTERIALLNNDTRTDPKWLEELNAALDAHPEVGFCASKMLNYFQPDVIDTAGDEIGVAMGLKRGHLQKDGPEYSTPRYIFGACAGAAIYRKAMLDQIGLLDESFGTNFEDVDLSFRAQLAGWRCWYVPTAIVYHKVGETKRRVSWKQLPSYRNSKVAWLKNAPLPLVLKYTPTLLKNEAIRVLVSAGVRRRRFEKPELEKVAMLLAADWQVLMRMPSTLKERRRIQRQRVVSTEYIDSMLLFPP